ncbi:hypothetical protein GGI12_002275 [Dipsacomyces acuminosporus]|nr:hypothetical protein GGI12_002275 [Dipsacomyces acuminosporus]
MLLKNTILLLAATAVAAVSASPDPELAKRETIRCMAIGAACSGGSSSDLPTYPRLPFSRPRRGDVVSDGNGPKKPSTGGRRSKDVLKRGRSPAQVFVDIIGGVSNSRYMHRGPFNMQI